MLIGVTHGPKRSHHSLTISDILPSSQNGESQDGEFLKQRTVQYTQRFLVEEFQSLGDLNHFLSEDECLHSATKGTVAPLKVVFLHKKYIESNIAILHQFQSDINLNGCAQVHAHTVYSWPADVHTHEPAFSSEIVSNTLSWSAGICR